MATAPKILTIAGIVEKELKNHPLVVVSALSGITDKLLSLIEIPESELAGVLREIEEAHLDLAGKLFRSKEEAQRVIEYVQEKIGELRQLLEGRRKSQVFSDKIVSFGEILSSYLIAHGLKDQGINAKQAIATDFIVTTSNFGSADFIPNLTEKKVKDILKPLIAKGVVPVVTGFIGSTLDNKVATLGRGGSDYTASILGYCLGAEEVQIWTDVDGVYDSDPKVVADARLIAEISYKEASEMATFGAKVLHPRTIRPAIQKSIPVRVLNSSKPDNPGTLITRSTSTQKGLKAIAFKRKTALINIYSTDMLFQKGYLAKVFEIFSRESISVDLVSVSEVSISVTLDEHPKIARVISELKKFAQVTHTAKVGVISLVGEDIVSSSHVLMEVSNLFHQLKIPIRMISLGASEVNISFVLDEEDVEQAVRLIHEQILLKSQNKSPFLRRPNGKTVNQARLKTMIHNS